MRITLVLLFCFCIGLLISGCEKEAGKDNSDTKTTSVKKEHDHPPHGRNGGHPISLDGADFGAESKFAKTGGYLMIFITDPTFMEKNIKISADKVVVRTTVGDQKEYELESIEATDGKTDQFRSTNSDAKNAVALGAELVITMDGKTFTGKIDKHTH